MTGCPSGVPAFPAPARLLGDDLPALGGMLVLYCGRAGVQFAPTAVVLTSWTTSRKRTFGSRRLTANLGGKQTRLLGSCHANNGHLISWKENAASGFQNSKAAYTCWFT